jgi:hypothetical protein
MKLTKNEEVNEASPMATAISAGTSELLKNFDLARRP